jgi:CheY-like chemotaxis protein
VSTKLDGVRVVIVEDNYVVARSLEALVGAHGCEVTGIAGTLDRAIDLVTHKEYDVAILDIDLSGENVAPVAELAQERERPMLFLTGYADMELLPDILRSWPRLDKPVEPRILISTLLDLVQRAALDATQSPAAGRPHGRGDGG